MSDSLPEAKIRVRIDHAGALREQERLEEETDKNARRGRRRRQRDAEREASRGRGRMAGAFRFGGNLARGNVPGALSGMGGKAAKLAGVALVVAAIMEAIENVLPVASATVKEALPAGLEETVGAFVDDAMKALSDEITELRARLSAVMATTSGTADVMRAKLLLGAAPTVADSWNFAKDYYEVIRALHAAERQQKKLTKHVMVDTFAKLLTGNLEG